MNGIEAIILFIAIDWILKAVFGEWLYAWIDAKMYGGIYEESEKAKGKSEKENQKLSGFWMWLFEERDVKILGFVFRNAVPRYRIFQKMIILIYWGGAYILFYSVLPLWIIAVSFAGIFCAYYWMKFERRYYYWAGQENEMYLMENDRVNVYWLARGYFSGYWLFKNGYHFRGWVFDLSSIIGTVLLYLSGLVMLLK